jgi:hypothetical protein
LQDFADIIRVVKLRRGALTFDLPALPQGQQWHRLVDTALTGGQDFSEAPGPLATAQQQYQVAARSSVALVASPVSG